MAKHPIASTRIDFPSSLRFHLLLVNFVLCSLFYAVLLNPAIFCGACLFLCDFRVAAPPHSTHPRFPEIGVGEWCAGGQPREGVGVGVGVEGHAYAAQVGLKTFFAGVSWYDISSMLICLI